jgi:hypothetical protein
VENVYSVMDRMIYPKTRDHLDMVTQELELETANTPLDYHCFFCHSCCIFCWKKMCFIVFL